MAEQMMQEAAGKTIPAGYKQTEVGVIPEDWDIASLGSLLKETPRYGINAPAVPLTGDTPVYIRITDISDDGYFSPGEKVGVNSPLSGMYFLSAGDIVLARTGASVGKSYLYNKNDGQLVYAGFLIKVSPNQERLSSMFLSQYLKSHQYWNWVVVNSMRSGQPGINGSEYANLLIPTPTIEEQTAIANVLSDSDALIDALEQLIAKKQAIKSATMQQLLTSRTRLPAFALRPDGTPKGYKPSELGDIPEDWEIQSISNLGSIITGSTPSTAVDCYWGGSIPWVTPTDIGNKKDISNSERKITKRGLQSIRSLPANSVLVTCIASIGKNAILRSAGACNQQINAVIPNEGVDVDYLYYTVEFSKERLKQCAGVTATPIISKALFSEFILSFPKS
jgi:type I restriction enzyme S subunit